MLLAFPAFAQTKPAYSSATKLSSDPHPPAWLDTASIYTPEGCEFQIAFPEAPYTGKQCSPIDPNDCNPVTTFTKVYSLDATIAYRVNCLPTSGDKYDQYSDNVMKSALFAMAQPSHLTTSQTAFGILPQTKMAVLLGSGKAPNGDDLIYTGQVWVGHKSILTIEGKLTGKYNAESDKLFAEILKTAKLRAEPAGSDKNGKSDKAKK